MNVLELCKRVDEKYAEHVCSLEKAVNLVLEEEFGSYYADINGDDIAQRISDIGDVLGHLTFNKLMSSSNLTCLPADPEVGVD